MSMIIFILGYYVMTVATMLLYKKTKLCPVAMVGIIWPLFLIMWPLLKLEEYFDE